MLRVEGDFLHFYLCTSNSKFSVICHSYFIYDGFNFKHLQQQNSINLEYTLINSNDVSYKMKRN